MRNKTSRDGEDMVAETLQQYIEHARGHMDGEAPPAEYNYFRGQLSAFKLILEGKISDVVYEGRRDWD